jgi:hypothetical protein
MRKARRRVVIAIASVLVAVVTAGLPLTPDGSRSRRLLLRSLGPQPQRRLGRLHGLLHHRQQLSRHGVQIDLVPQPGSQTPRSSARRRGDAG